MKAKQARSSHIVAARLHGMSDACHKLLQILWSTECLQQVLVGIDSSIEVASRTCAKIGDKDPQDVENTSYSDGYVVTLVSIKSVIKSNTGL